MSRITRDDARAAAKKLQRLNFYPDVKTDQGAEKLVGILDALQECCKSAKHAHAVVADLVENTVDFPVPSAIHLAARRCLPPEPKPLVACPICRGSGWRHTKDAQGYEYSGRCSCVEALTNA